MKTEQSFATYGLPKPEPEQATDRIRSLLCTWFSVHRRDLPWRRTYTPYHVWISEVMLQQTQMERGVQYFERWMERFPTIAGLAEASEEEVLQYWEGLGYYSRARNILKAARMIRDRFGGEFPADTEDIGLLPGIGPYTRAAIASIAFQTPVPSIDANVERILARIFAVPVNVRSDEGRRRIEELAWKLLDRQDPRTSNQALMEFGALVCSRRPVCMVCPVQTYCVAYHEGLQSMFPVRGALQPRAEQTVVAAVFLHEDRVLLRKMPENGLWPGLWVFPNRTVCMDGSERWTDGTVETDVSDEAGIRAVQEMAGELGLISGGIRDRLPDTHSGPYIFVYCHTRWKVRISAYCVSLGSGPDPVEIPDCAWVRTGEIRSMPMPSPHRTIAEKYLGKDV